MEYRIRYQAGEYAGHLYVDADTEDAAIKEADRRILQDFQMEKHETITKIVPAKPNEYEQV